ncbi:DUF3826 domain-containing protein [Mucilaginibacter paludis]|uniref:DUF3826 domain-containing protein n=1 Tax=Mucilaginibacter paludis DSM 18603 TaxID=714943 RepID=H1Y9R6_9SPHI|nr:DUF3826 domain-containing protein [Mucilaginibacter paludis]EHQ31099.1 hypothetical protein Mucpa_7056 [Mucilaginibacter paludis DSM 18603]
MKSTYIIFAFSIACALFSAGLYAQTATPAGDKATTVKSKSDPDVRAGQWVAALNLNDAAKEARVAAVITAHLMAVRDWNNNHPYTLTPEGINPITGKVFSKLERQLIINSTIPKTVHDDLMAGLRKDLTEEQVELILDKYTIGKVAFTMSGYKSIVPDLTQVEESFILTNLKLAREQAVDYKNIDQISVIFKIYKTKIEDYFNNNGRNWKQMYKNYADQAKAKKAAGNAKPAKP